MPDAERLYFDNAATSYPKPECVGRALADFSTRLGASPGRGAYAEAREAEQLMHRCRRRINTLINGESPDHIIFTLNTTDALNLAIKGIFTGDARSGLHETQREKQGGMGGGHCVTTWMDHNSVLRPLNAIVDRSAVEQTRVPCDSVTGLVDPAVIRAAIRPDTKLVACVHASNVTGTVQPIAEIGAICREMAVPLLVDAAQTIGHLPIDVQEMHIDLLAFPGHKGLLGPLGTGGLYMRPGMERLVATTREGGTGSRSEDDTHPTNMPDKYEAGSHNAPGIIALSESVAWILDRTVERLAEHETDLMRTFLDTIAGDGENGLTPGIHLLGPPTTDNRVGVFAIRIDGMPPSEVSRILEEKYAVLSRSGLHCAPLAHATFSSDPASCPLPEHPGATRLSMGPFLTQSDVRRATGALVEIATEAARTTVPMHT